MGGICELIEQLSAFREGVYSISISTILMVLMLFVKPIPNTRRLDVIWIRVSHSSDYLCGLLDPEDGNS